MKFFKRSKKASFSIEYILIIILVVLALIAALLLFSGKLSTTIGESSEAISANVDKALISTGTFSGHSTTGGNDDNTPSSGGQTSEDSPLGDLNIGETVGDIYLLGTTGSNFGFDDFEIVFHDYYPEKVKPSSFLDLQEFSDIDYSKVSSLQIDNVEYLGTPYITLGSYKHIDDDDCFCFEIDKTPNMTPEEWSHSEYATSYISYNLIKIIYDGNTYIKKKGDYDHSHAHMSYDINEVSFYEDGSVDYKFFGELEIVLPGVNFFDDKITYMDINGKEIALNNYNQIGISYNEEKSDAYGAYDAMIAEIGQRVFISTSGPHAIDFKGMKVGNDNKLNITVGSKNYSLDLDVDSYYSPSIIFGVHGTQSYPIIRFMNLDLSGQADASVMAKISNIKVDGVPYETPSNGYIYLTDKSFTDTVQLTFDYTHDNGSVEHYACYEVNFPDEEQNQFLAYVYDIYD